MPFSNLFKSKDVIDSSSFYAILESIPVSVVISDPNQEDNPIIYCNKMFERVTGYSRLEVIGKNCRFLQGRDTNPIEVSKMRSAINNKEPFNIVVANYRRNGEKFMNELIILPVFSRGELKYFVGIQNDLGKPIYIR